MNPSTPYAPRRQGGGDGALRNNTNTSTMNTPTYYEQVRDHIERLGECCTSDAQGIIGAYALKQYGHRQNGILDAIDWTMDDAEDAATDPEALARTILGLS